ncbi:hypothetical protein [Consotaella salsifontis]|uniref:Uncharacterized protein n=1 Tax=Consotaella salsifontis TaxID=1365950 RepID=A0A1T4T3I9_9HYPH|nr:hypothetical protein [Consotaella salsifontis]SKA35075.1 hypothetical protein SAMN05428963_11857 [Consotaella salsifontis]
MLKKSPETEARGGNRPHKFAIPFVSLPLSHRRRREAEATFDVGVFKRIESEPSHPFGKCYSNVQSVVARKGGSPVTGWQILLWPSILIQAVHHCVWRRPDGSLLDISGKYPGDRKPYSIFVEEPERDLDFSGPIYIPPKAFLLTQAPQASRMVAAADRLHSHRYRIFLKLRDAGVPYGTVPSLVTRLKLQADFTLEQRYREDLSRAIIACSHLSR